MPGSTIYTIGHSTNPIEVFIGLLTQHGVTAVADVRSTPYSRFNPQFDRETLMTLLRDYGISYVFLGKELGARSDDPSCYRDGKVQYDLLAKTELFSKGIERVKKGAQEFRIALMCAEKEPLDCHRTILVARELVERGLSVRHILADGRVEDHDKVVDRLLGLVSVEPDDLFRSRDDAVREAYAKRADEIAYAEATHHGGDEEASQNRGIA